MGPRCGLLTQVWYLKVWDFEIGSAGFKKQRVLAIVMGTCEWLDAPTYEKAAEKLVWQAPQVLFMNTLPHLEGYERIIDVGCGSGLSGGLFIDAGFVVDGIDKHAHMIDAALDRGYGRGFVTKVETGNARIVSLAGSYDCLISCGMFGDYVYVSALRSVLELLKQRAVVGIAGRAHDLAKRFRRSSNGNRQLQNLEDELEHNGFTILEHEIGVGHHSARGFPVPYVYVVAGRE